MSSRDIFPQVAPALCCCDPKSPSGATFLKWQHVLASPAIPAGSTGKGLWEHQDHPEDGDPPLLRAALPGAFSPISLFLKIRLFLNPIPHCAAAQPSQQLHYWGCHSFILWVTSCFSWTPHELQLLHRDGEYLTFQACPVLWDIPIMCCSVKPP